jgi:hypothetical protein
MKKFKLQIQNSNGDIDTETEVTIGDKDILVVQYPDEYTKLQRRNLLKYLSKMLKNGLVVLPESIKFKIIKGS